MAAVRAAEAGQPRNRARGSLLGNDNFESDMKWLCTIVVGIGLLPAAWAAGAGPQPSYVNRGTTSYAVPPTQTNPNAFNFFPSRVFPNPAIPPIFINPGTVNFTNPPQINATAFLNLGNFGVQTILPYDFQNTLYFTNRGTMIGAPGFRFDYTDDFGVRRPAYNFVNEAPGVIAGLEANGYSGYSNVFFQTMMQIRATNILSPGYLQVGNVGTLRLEGQNVNLARGGLEVQPVVGSPVANVYFELTDSEPTPDAFYGDNAIYDLYWGAGLQQIPIPGPINTANILRFFGADLLASAPTHQVLSGPGWNIGYTSFSTFVPGTYMTAIGNTGIVAFTGLTLTNFDGSISNIIVPTNIFRQAVVVGVSDTNFTVRTKFGPPGPAGMGLGIVAVEIASGTTNVARGIPEASSLYFVDYLGYDTNTLVVTNLGPWVPTGRPYAYEIYRELPFFESLGANGNSPLFNTFLYHRSFSNVFATNLYAGYAASIDNVAARPPVVPGSTTTNTPGRIEIQADTLDLTKTRIRGITLVEIKTAHLKSSDGAVVDVENLIYDIGSTNGLLTMRNLARESAHAVRGELQAWTGIWSNQFALVLSNWFIDANTNYFNPVTNAVDVNLYCLILSADLLARTQQVITHTLALNSTNVIVDDPYLVSDKMLINAEGLTVNGQIALTNVVPDWTYALTPNLRFLTNHGTIRPWNVGYYGADFPAGRRLERFINTGTLEAEGHEIACDYFEDSGVVQNNNDLRLFANTAIFQGSFHAVGGGAHYFGQDYKLRNHRVVADRGLFINATNSFTDAGAGSNNSFELLDGFHLIRKPLHGDLLGTLVQTRAPRFVSVAHTWAAEDRGASAAGFTDNMAIGRLRLESLPAGELRLGPPVDGMGLPVPGNFGLYVDYLEFSTNLVAGGPTVAEDPEAYLVIEPGLTVYFAASNLNAEDLDGRFNGRLRWVREFAGPRSGVDVALRTGRTIRINIGLVDSRQIDSDGDGLVNAFDIHPFDDVLITDFEITSVNPYQTRISWRAAAQTEYFVERTADLKAADWSVIATRANPLPDVQILTVTDVINQNSGAAGGGQQYYRVRYEP